MYQYQPFQQYQQPVHGFVFVEGIEGAKAYWMPPNSEMPLFDANDDKTMYIKTTDATGYPTITIADCIRREQPAETGVASTDELRRVYSDLAAQVEELKGAVNVLVSASAEPGNVIPAGSNGKPTAGRDAANAVQ